MILNDERILIEGKLFSKRIPKIFLFSAGIINTLTLIVSISIYFNSACLLSSQYNTKTYAEYYQSFDRFLFNQFWREQFGYFFILSYILAFIGLVLLIMLMCDLVVTTKRVYGMVWPGKRIDLPLNHISALGVTFFKRIRISTSSGNIKFGCLKNAFEIHSVISYLLANQQQEVKPLVREVQKTQTVLSNADELKKYKELLDMDAITQEEYDLKKKQLLGL